MKKILPLIFLIFCLVLNTAAIAEEPAPYNPGDITNQLKLQALSQGLMLSHTFNAALDMDDTAFGEEHAADIDAVEKLLSGLTLYTAGGVVSDGLRVELAANYGDASASVGADVSVMAGREGLSLESSLIDGKRVTVKWDTLLAMAGLSEEQIQQLNELLDADYSALFEELQAKLQEAMTTAANLVTPYIGVVAGFVQSLPVDAKEGVPAEGDFPAVDHSLAWTVKPADLARLMDSFADTLEQDENLPALSETAGVQISVDELIPQLREAAEALRADESDDSATLEVGYCDSFLPAYLLCTASDSKANSSVLFALIGEPGEEENTYAIHSGLVLNENGERTQPFSAAVNLTLDPEDPKAFVCEVQMNAGLGDDAVSVYYGLSKTPAVFDDGLPGYQITANEQVTATESGTTAVTTEQVSGYNKLNAQGGESSYAEGSASAASDDQEIMDFTFNIAQDTRPDENKVFETETSMHFASPAVGLNDLNLYAYSTPVAYDADAVAALALYPLEEMDEDTQNTVVMEAMMNAQQLVQSFSEIAPAEVMDFIQRMSAPAEEEALPEAGNAGN